MKRPFLPVDVRRQGGDVDASQRHLVLRLHVCQNQTQHVVVVTGSPAGGGAGRGGGRLQNQEQVQETGQDRLNTHTHTHTHTHTCRPWESNQQPLDNKTLPLSHKRPDQLQWEFQIKNGGNEIFTNQPEISGSSEQSVCVCVCVCYLYDSSLCGVQVFEQRLIENFSCVELTEICSRLHTHTHTHTPPSCGVS